MCGWLPFCTRLSEQVDLDNDAELDTTASESGGEDHAVDPFERDDDLELTPSDPGQRALCWLREEAQVPSASSHLPDIVAREVPVFLGHGTEDDRVSVILGRNASLSMRDIGVDVVWKEYEGLGHWYSGPMRRNLVGFLHAHISQ